MVITDHQSTEEQEGFIGTKVFTEEVSALTFSVAFWIQLVLEIDA